MGSRRPLARAGAVGVVVLTCDQVSKQIVRDSIPLHSSRSVVSGVLSLVHEQNSGVAFSLLTGSEAGVIVLTVAIVGGLLAYLSRRRERPWIWFACGLLIGGAVGNLIDRVRQGAVTDFVKLPHWPAFNVADTAITVGMITLILVVGRGGAAARSG